MPTLTGTLQEGSVLIANTSGITDPDHPGVNVSEHWSGIEMVMAVLIKLLPGNTYTLDGNDVGKQIFVKFNYSENHPAIEDQHVQVILVILRLQYSR